MIIKSEFDLPSSRSAEGLYDIAADTYEQRNLASDPGSERVKQRLASRLNAWMAHQGRPGHGDGVRGARSPAPPGEPCPPRSSGAGSRAGAGIAGACRER